MIELEKVRIVSVHDAPWSDVETVFGTRGDPADCWCQYFKLTGDAWKNRDAGACKSALQQQAQHATPSPGVIAYLDDEPVGWCAVEPRTNYSRLTHTRAVVDGSPDALDDAGVWSVTCFVVRVGFRRRGVGGALLNGAVAQAQALGARVLEGYPVDVAVRGKTSSADLYHGTFSLFTAAGFAEVARPSADRPVMQRLTAIDN